MYGGDSPCKDCTARRIKCHAHCAAYKAYHKARAFVSREKARMNLLNGYHAENVAKRKKAAGRKSPGKFDQ